MGYRWLLVWTILLSMSATAAINSYSAAYNILFDKALVDVTFTFEEFHSQYTFTLPKDTRAIEVSGLTFETEETDEALLLTVNGNLFNQVNIKYITNAVIERTSDRFFILDLSSLAVDKKSLTVQLPEGATLKYRLDSPQVSIIPRTDGVETDGKQIIIRWNPEDLADTSSVLVIYTLPEESRLGLMLLLGVVALVVVGGGYWRYQKKKPVSSPYQKSDLTKNLLEEEKSIMEVLLAAKWNELWQKELQQKSGLSKVRLSRKLRSLEQKGLIEKIPYGNTNKIRLGEGKTKEEHAEGKEEPRKRAEKYFKEIGEEN